MKLRVWATIMMTFASVVSSVSQAQWGYGMYGGMQPCAGYGAAGGASDEADEIAELKQDRSELRREKREVEKAIRELERDRDKLKEAITDVVKADTWDVLSRHMDYGMNCCIQGQQSASSSTTTTVNQTPYYPAPAPAPVPTTGTRSGDTSSTITIIEKTPAAPRYPPGTQAPAPIEDRSTTYTPPAPAPQPAPQVGQEPYEPAQTFPAKPPEDIVGTETPDSKPPTRDTGVRPIKVVTPPKPAQEEPPKPAVRPNKTSSIGIAKNSRMPAAETTVPAGASAQAQGGNQSANQSALDAPKDDGFSAFSGSSAWTSPAQTLCYESTLPYTTQGWAAICKSDGYVSDRVCRERVFQKGAVRAPQVTNCGRSLDRYRKLTKEVDKAKDRVNKIEDEITAIGFKIGDIKMAERLDRDLEADCPTGTCYAERSRRSSRTRGPSVGQTLLAVGMDALSIFGNYKIGQKANEWNARTGHEALPYSTNIGGFYPFRTAGLYGGMYGGANGSYGCSPTMAGGGGAFGPYGMTGPFGAGGGIYGGAGSPFGYPGMGGYPQYGGGMYMPGGGSWGMNGPWGVGQWPGGYPGMGGFVGGVAGGIAGGFTVPIPGVAGGMAGGFAGYPGMAGGMAGGFAGYPGMAGGMAGGFAGYPGMAGGMAGGFAGYPGMAGGMAGGFAGYPGMAGGMAGGFAGYPGMAGGMAGGFAGMAGGMAGGFPGALAGGFAGGGFAGGGFAGGFGGDPQSLQLYYEAQRRYADQAQSRLRLYQGFMQEYMQFQMKWQQYFGTGGAGADIIFSGGGGGSSTLPVGSGPGSGTTPGRTR